MKHFCSLLVSALAIFSLLAVGVQGATEIKNKLLGAGGSFQAPLYQDWTNTFSVLAPDTEIKYEGITQSDGRTRLLNGQVDFAGADYNIFSDTDYAAHPTYRLFPTFAGNVGFSYNLPSFTRSDPRLALSREIVSKIYRGIITKWNDPELVQLQRTVYPNQPAVVVNSTYSQEYWANKMPNQVIRLGLRADAALVTTILGTGLAAADSWWKDSFGDSIQRTSIFPSNITSLPNRSLVRANLGMLGHLTTTQYAMGYHPFPYLVQFPEIRHFVMINKQGNIADPTDLSQLTNVMADLATNNLTVDQYRIVLPEIIDPPQPYAWPYSTFNYIVVDTNATLGNCGNRTALYKWVRWAITDPTAKDIAGRKGYVQIPPNLAKVVVDRIKTWECIDPATSVSALTLADTAHQQRTDGTSAVFAVEVILFSTVFLGMTLFFFYVSKNSETPALEYFFSAVFTMGSLLELVAIVVWYLKPTSDAVCAARVWFTALGLTLILASMFTRLYHLYKIYGQYRRNKLMSMEMMTKKLVMLSAMVVLISLLAQFIILILWQSINPVYATNIYRDNINMITEWQCQGASLGGWLIAEIVFVGIMLGFGIWVIFLAWNLRGHASDTRGLLISTYNMFLLICVLIPLFIVAYFDETAIFYIASIVITFATVSTAVALYWRKLVMAKESYSSRTKSRSRTNTATGGSKGLSKHSKISIQASSTVSTDDTSKSDM